MHYERIDRLDKSIHRNIVALHLAAPVEDVTPISGTLTYAPGVKSGSFSVRSVLDIEEEGREVFVVALLGTTGGATLSVTDSRTTLSGETICCKYKIGIIQILKLNLCIKTQKNFIFHIVNKSQYIHTIFFLHRRH